MRSALRKTFELALPVTLVAFLAASACGDGGASKKVRVSDPDATAGEGGLGNAGDSGAPAVAGGGSGGHAGTSGSGGASGEGGADIGGGAPGGEAGMIGNAGAAGGGSEPLLTIVSTVRAASPVDRTGQEFGAPTPDGTDDATVTATINGAFDALLWVSTDAQGAPDVMPHEWDTLVGPEPLPDIGSGYATGSETWTIAVLDGTTLINDSTGHAALPPGTHDLTLSVAATPKMVTGQHFRIYARLGATWVPGPVFVW